MIIKNVSKPISLPEDLKREIEKVRIQLTINQNEVNILKKTRISEQGVVEHLVRDRQFLTEKKEEINREVIEKMKELDRIDLVIDSKKKEFNLITSELETSLEKLRLSEKKKVKIDENVKNIEEDIEKRLVDIKKKEEEIRIKSEEVSKKLADFKQFMKKYDSMEQI